MSSKTSKRRQKRLNTNEEEVEISDKSISPKKLEESITKETIQEVELIIVETEPSKTDATEEQNSHKSEENGHKIEENGHNIEENGQTDDHHEEKNGTTEATPNESHISVINITDSGSLVIIDSDTEEEIHLCVDDTDNDHETSPVLTGMTTRSQKHSPKSDQTENSTEMSDAIEEEITEIEDDESIKTDDNTIDPEEKDTTNASIFVNLGNDTTRNIDITITSAVEDTVSNSFAEVNKDVSYGQALRTLSGRKTLRRDSPFVLRHGKSNLEKDMTDARKSYIPHISSVKRKNIGDIPEESKRFKSDGSTSPGLFSYISSPLNSFRNKISRSEIPSSTPKLMSYNKYAQGNNIIDDMSHIDLDEKVEAKKWCSIM